MCEPGLPKSVSSPEFGKAFPSRDPVFSFSVSRHSSTKRRTRRPRRIEHYWLCDPCSLLLTLTFEKGRGMITSRFPRLSEKASQVLISQNLISQNLEQQWHKRDRLPEVWLDEKWHDVRHIRKHLCAICGDEKIGWQSVVPAKRKIDGRITEGSAVGIRNWPGRMESGAPVALLTFRNLSCTG